MRVGIFLPIRWRRFSLNMEELGRALAGRGHEPLLVCRGVDEDSCAIPVRIASTAEELSPDFWRSLGLDMAVCFTNMGSPGALGAMRDAGIFVATRADSDGQFGFRVFPSAGFLRIVHPATGAVDFAKRLRHFINCCLHHYREFDRQTLETIGASDVLVIETETARSNLAKFLAWHKRSDLLSRVHVVPHPVAASFLETPAAPDPGPGVLCIGRWNEDQKNAPLLCRAIRLLQPRVPGIRFVIAGSGADKAFAGAAGLPGIRIAGVVPNGTIPSMMDEARFVLSASRWEGHPISGLEALCRGRTVVATPLPGFLDMTEGGRFGTIAGHHSARALAGAALREMDRWGRGERDPERISAHWRPIVCHDAVVGKILMTYGR